MNEEWTYDSTMDAVIASLRTFVVAGPVLIPHEQVRKVQRTLDMADSAGIILHPSEWMRAGDQIDRQKKIVALYRSICRELEEIFPADKDVLRLEYHGDQP